MPTFEETLRNLPKGKQRVEIKAERGRPPIFIDLAEVSKLAFFQCTDLEIAVTIGVSVRTICRAKRSPAYQEADERGRAAYRVALRQALIASALQDRNQHMLRALAKRDLGMDLTLELPHNTGNVSVSMSIENKTEAPDKAPTLADLYRTVQCVTVDGESTDITPALEGPDAGKPKP
jgi:hypothetical protein